MFVALFIWSHIAQQTAQRLSSPDQQPRIQLRLLEKGGGKNARHANQKAKESAKQAYDKAKSAHDQLFRKPNRNKEDKKLLDHLKKQLEHWRKKKDWTGENHSQKNKSN